MFSPKLRITYKSGYKGMLLVRVRVNAHIHVRSIRVPVCLIHVCFQAKLLCC